MFDGQWFFEEYQGQCRFGFRVTAKLHEEQSEYQKLTVYDTPFFGRVLTLDDLIMFTERDEFVYHEMLVHVPLLLHPNPRAVLIIGGGDCGCAREVLKHPSIESVVQCDIDERVTRVCEEWFQWPKDTQSDPRLELTFSDGIQFIRDQHDRFDLVIVDSTDPIGPAVGLFTADFYRDVSRALRPGGVLSAQTESPHWSPDVVAKIYGELRQVFSEVSAYMGSIPTYPSGAWTWALASEEITANDPIDEERASLIEDACRYYTSEIQRAAFVLPGFGNDAVYP